MALQKKYVAVDSHTTTEGKETPIMIYWEDGRKFPIGRVIDRIDREHSKVGGTGMCFICEFEGGGVTRVYHEEDKWFVAAKVQAAEN